MDAIISNALSSLKIPVAFMEYSGPAKKYIMYQVIRENETEFFDDENHAELIYVNLAYWYHKPEDKALISEIKKLMKNAGFFLDDSSDMKDGNSYGRNFDFIYKQYK